MRGRGGRGRGRSRGGGARRGGGRSGSRGGNAGAKKDTTNTENSSTVYDVNSDPQALFTGTASADQHFEAQKTNKTRYAAAFAVAVKNKVQITQSRPNIIFRLKIFKMLEL